MNKTQLLRGILFFCLCFCINLITCVSNADNNEIPVTTNSAEARALYNEGMTLFDKGNFKQAIEKFEHAVNKDPNFGTAYLYMGISFAYEGDEKKADELVNKAALATGLSKAEQLIIQWAKAGNDDDRNKQKEITDELTAMHPNNATVQLLTGMYYSEINKHEKATEFYEKAVKQSPTFANYDALACSYFSVENYNEALSTYQKMVEMAPENVSALRGTGLAYKQLGKLDEAIQNLDKALSINPYLSWVRSNLGDSYILVDMPEKAKYHYQKLLESATDNIERRQAHYRLVGYYVVKNQLEEGYKELLKVSQMFEDAQEDQHLWGNYHRRGDYCILWDEATKAKQDYDIWIEMVDKSQEPDEYRNNQRANYYLNMVRLALMDNDVDKAKSINQEFRQLKIDNLKETKPYRKIQGLIAAAEGRYDEALAAFEKTTSPSSRNATTTMRIARAYEGKGDIEKARAHYQEILDSPGLGYYAFPYLLCRRQAKERLASLSEMTTK